MMSSAIAMPTKNKTSIACLPDKALLTIFDYAVQLDSMSVFLTCRRWASLRTEVYARRRCLHLMIGGGGQIPTGPMVIAAEWIHCPTLTKARTEWLVRTLANIEQLMLMLEDPQPDQGSVIWAQVLLARWSDRLVVLNYWQKRFHAESTYPMLARINSLTKLETLQLTIYPVKDDDKSNPTRVPKLELARVHFPILGLLKSKLIFIIVGCPILDFCRWFDHHNGGNTGLELEFLEMVQFEGYSRSTLNAIYRYQFLDQFSSVGIPCSEVADLGGLRKYCRRFSGLDSISLEGYLRISLAEATQCLALLPKLKELELRLCGTLFHLGNRGGRGSGRRSGRGGGGDDRGGANDGYAPLPSVTELSIYLTFGNPCDGMPEPSGLSSIPFGLILPNLEKLYLLTENVYKCPTPHRHPARGTEEEMIAKKMAYARVFALACPKLVSVCTDYNDESAVTWTKEDLIQY